MNQEKEITQTVNSSGDYLAPSVKVLEIKARRVICASGNNSPQQYDDDGTWMW